MDALAAGTLTLAFAWPLGGRLIPLRADYPDSFPRLRPAVALRTAREEFPARHCSPFDGTLCLLGRDSGQWLPGWTLRRLLEEQLAHCLDGTGPEDPQGEPAEYWWNFYGLDDSYCLVDSAWTLGEARSGMLDLRLSACWREGRPRIAAAVAEVRDETNAPIAAWAAAFPEQLSAGAARTVAIPWLRVRGPFMPTGDGAQLLALLDAHPHLTRQRPVPLTLTSAVRLFAIAYDSELAFRDPLGLGWLFVALHGSRKRVERINRRKPPRISAVRTLRAGARDIGARVPAAGHLHGKEIAIFGLGALGAPLALEIARSGCRRLHLIDHDIVEPGNAVRYPLGASAWGRHKAAVLAEFIANEYPWTEPVAHIHNIGVPGGERLPGDDELFARVLDGADLAVDATASYGVTAIIADHCRDKDLPLIALFASPDVTGGVVARYGPSEGCPTCLEFAWHGQAIARPPGLGSDAGLQQPPGCAELTFTGASYDLQELSLQAMRLIVDTLAAPAEARRSLVYTLSLADAAGRIPPRWRVDRLPRDRDCSCGSDRR